MAKAESNGVYVIDGHRFKIRKGDVIPDGAEFTATADDAEDAVTEERSLDAAPENKAQQSAPQNRAKKAE